MASIVVQGEKLIARPIEVVRSQFVDMAHHATTRVHADLQVTNVRAQEGGCRFTGRRRIFGMLQEDEIEVKRDNNGNSTLRFSFYKHNLPTTLSITMLRTQHKCR